MRIPLFNPVFSQESSDAEKGANMNISAYRLLFIYKQLCQEEQITLKALNNRLADNAFIGRSITQETLHKYLQTLRLLGCQITRTEEHGQVLYRLISHPIELSLTPEEVQALQTVIQQLASQPLQSSYHQFTSLMRNVTRMKPTIDHAKDIEALFSLANSWGTVPTQRAQVFQKYCSEGQVLEIRYPDGDDNIVMFLVEPQEVIFHQKRFLLVGNDPKTNRRVRYDLEKIASHRQLPSRVRTQTIKTPVSFKLTGRVARNYRPYPGEAITDKGEFLLVGNRTDDVSMLLLRLIKYGDQCQIISPTSVREEMKRLIEQILTTLESDTP